MGVLEAENSVTEPPASAAEAAVHMPAIPAPTTMMSSSIVSAIWSSGMGSGATSKLHLGRPLLRLTT